MKRKQGFLVRLIQKAFSTMPQPAHSQLSWLLPRTNYDYKRDVGDGTDSSVVMAVLFWIMRRFAEAKIIIKDDGEQIDGHDAIGLLERPNKFYSGRLMRMACALSYHCDGNVYLIKVRNKQFKPVELWYVPHWMITPHWPETGSAYIDYYEYRPAFQKYQVDPSDVIHIKLGIDPYNTRKGISPLKSLFREIFTDDEAANFTASLLRNMGIPGLIISPAADNVKVDNDDKKAIEERFAEYGKDRRGKPFVFKGKTDVKQFGFSPQAMDLGSLREIPEERVTAILGVPAAVVGFGTGLQQTKVGATMKEMREAAYEDCIIPMQNIFADEFNTQLLPDFEESPERFKVDFDLSGIRVLQEDENSRSERIRAEAASGLIMQSEARKMLGYEIKPEHDVYFIPNSVIPTPAGMVGVMPDEPVPSNDDPPMRSFLPFGAKSAAWRSRLLAQFKRDLDSLSGAFARDIRRKFDDMGDAAADAWEELVAQRGIETFSRSDVTVKDMSIEQFYADLIAGEIDTDAEKLGYVPQYIKVMKKTFATVKSITGLGVNLTDPAEARVMNEGGKRVGLLDITGDTKKAIFSALADARNAGEGPYEAARRIRDYVSEGRFRNAGAKYRADLIARTETKNAQNVSSIEAYKSGGVRQVEIVDGQLPTSDDDCIARNRTIIPIDQAWNIDDHPNGTLSFSPVISDTFEGGQT